MLFASGPNPRGGWRMCVRAYHGTRLSGIALLVSCFPGSPSFLIHFFLLDRICDLVAWLAVIVVVLVLVAA